MVRLNKSSVRRTDAPAEIRSGYLPTRSQNILPPSQHVLSKEEKINICCLQRRIRKDIRLCNIEHTHRRVYPKVSGLAAWSENCK
jgi:hypothetical protein